MKYIYDLILNYNKDYLEFYEWQRDDNIININKVPIIKINSMQYEEIITNKIKVTDELLKKINNKTRIDRGFIKYSLLITDDNYVTALKFDEKGIVIEKSKLLFDEEIAILEEVNDLNMEFIDYEVLEKNTKELFLTRKERMIKELLLKEINSLFINKKYDEIDYLYKEIFSKDKRIYEEYRLLIDSINNHFNEKYLKLYEIIKLTQ